MSRTKTNSNKVTKPHKYRVSVYLGKELYATISGMADLMKIPVATATRILLETGVQLGKVYDKQGVEELTKYGKSKI